MCTEVQKNEKPQNCETCQQCDYEIEYADRSSSLGVLARDKLHLVTANGSITNLDVVFGYPFSTNSLNILDCWVVYLSNLPANVCE